MELGLAARTREAFEIRATYFNRRIENAIVAEPGTAAAEGVFPTAFVQNVPEETLEGIDGSVEVKVWRFSGKGTCTYLTQKRDAPEKRIYPKFFASGEIAFRQELFQNHLDLKIGMRGRFFTSHFGEQYNPLTMVYVENTVAELTQHGSVDLFLVGRVGSAYIHLLLENITDEQYMLTPFYPMQDRKLRFGVEWEFLD